MARAPGPKTEAHILAREGERRDAGADGSPSLDAELGRLFAAHRPQVLALCRRLTGDPERAEELVQEALAVAWRKLPEFQQGVRFGPWIYGIARNLCRNARRKHGELLSDDGVLDPDSDAAGTLRLLQRQERIRLLSDATRSLSPLEQEAVHLRYVEGLPLAELDALLGLKGSGARGLLQTCRRKLRRALEQQLQALGHGRSLLHSET